MASTSSGRGLAGLLVMFALGGAAATAAVLRGGSAPNFVGGLSLAPPAPPQLIPAAVDRDAAVPALRGAGLAGNGLAVSGVQTGFSSYGAAAAALALGAFLVSSGSRDDSVMTMFTKHDRKTRRGKIWRGTFGKYRMRPQKKRKLHAIKLGLRKWGQDFSLEQKGQPEPEHTWDWEIAIYNPMYYFPKYYMAAAEDAIEEYKAKMRQDGVWQKAMGKYGYQFAYKNWTPPGMEESAPPAAPDNSPPEEVAAALVGEKISAKAVQDLRERFQG